MSNVDTGGSLRRLSASTMTLCHHFDSTSDPEPQIMNQVRWVLLFEATAICPWTAHHCAQTFCKYLIWMQEAVIEVAASLNHDGMTSF
jgi:hypothetical protein